MSLGGDLPQIIGDGNPRDLIVKSLFFNGKNRTAEVFVLQDRNKSLEVDVDAQLIFN